MSTIVSPASAKLTTSIINPMLESIMETCKVLLGWELRRKSLDRRSSDSPLYDITAQVGLTGKVKGAIAISLEEFTALAIVEDFIGEHHTRINDEVRDAIGEIANNVVGGTKSKLDLGLNMGLPIVGTGENRKISFPLESMPMRFIFDSDYGAIYIDFGFVTRNV